MKLLQLLVEMGNQTFNPQLAQVLLPYKDVLVWDMYESAQDGTNAYPANVIEALLHLIEHHYTVNGGYRAEDSDEGLPEEFHGVSIGSLLQQYA